jgi:hypothetical protein
MGSNDAFRDCLQYESDMNHINPALTETLTQTMLGGLPTGVRRPLTHLGSPPALALTGEHRIARFGSVACTEAFDCKGRGG